MSLKRIAAALAMIAALAGGAGVALAAVAAHKVQTPALGSAAQMLMVHGAAGLAMLATAHRSSASRVWVAAAALVVSGSLLFALAVALPILADSRLLAHFAPVGGSTVMLGWAVGAFAAAREIFVAE